jgi:hypothetical protein
MAGGPDTPRRSVAAPCALQHAPTRSAWGDRFGGWLRRQLQRDGAERTGYYLRSPLLYAFGPDTAHGCSSDAAETAAPPACAELRVSLRAATDLSMELPLPQLGAHTHLELAAIIRAGLDEGDTVIVLDDGGHALTLLPAHTRAVRVDRC